MNYRHIIETCELTKSLSIPQNNYSNFIITKEIKWNNTIKISFKLNEEINYFNLFFILIAYFKTNLALCIAICTVFKNNNNDIIISQNESTLKFKNMNYEEFCQWISYRIKNDWKYNNDEEFYGIYLIFEKNLLELKSNQLNINLLENLKPIYPWPTFLLEKHALNFEKEKLLTEKIRSLEHEINTLKLKNKI